MPLMVKSPIMTAEPEQERTNSLNDAELASRVDVQTQLDSVAEIQQASQLALSDLDEKSVSDPIASLEADDRSNGNIFEHECAMKGDGEEVQQSDRICEDSQSESPMASQHDELHQSVAEHEISLRIEAHSDKTGQDAEADSLLRDSREENEKKNSFVEESLPNEETSDATSSLAALAELVTS